MQRELARCSARNRSATSGQRCEIHPERERCKNDWMRCLIRRRFSFFPSFLRLVNFSRSGEEEPCCQNTLLALFSISFFLLRDATGFVSWRKTKTPTPDVWRNFSDPICGIAQSAAGGQSEGARVHFHQPFGVLFARREKAERHLDSRRLRLGFQIFLTGASGQKPFVVVFCPVVSGNQNKRRENR